MNRQSENVQADGFSHWSVLALVYINIYRYQYLSYINLYSVYEMSEYSSISVHSVICGVVSL